MNKRIVPTLMTVAILAHTGLAIAQETPSKPAKQQALPLDHGPHAQLTPWEYQQKRQRAAAAAKSAS